MASPAPTPSAPARPTLPTLDAGGLKRSESARVELATPGVVARVLRPVLEDQRRPTGSAFLARDWPRVAEPLPESKLALELEWDGTCQRALVRVGEPVHFYGAGSAAAPLERSGRSFRLWARAGSESEPWGESPHVHPLGIALRVDGSALAVFIDSARDGLLRFGHGELELTTEGEPADLWLLEASDVPALLAALRELFGACALPPLWALGHQHLALGVDSATSLLERARRLRARHLPCDTLRLDSGALERGRPFSWSRSGFDEPARTLDELRETGFRTLVPLEPALPQGKHYPAHKSGVDHGHFVRDERGEPLRARAAHGPSSLPDFTQATSSAWWAGLAEKHAETGLDGYWSDTNLPHLPHVPGGTLPDEARHAGHGGGRHARFHNTYAREWSLATREGLAQARPTLRPFVLSRGADLGSARAAATWVCSPRASWEELRSQLARVLSLGLCGQPMVGLEVGGRSGTPSPELLARWFELAALMPLSLDSGREPFGHGQEADRAIKAALERRMRFLPTLSSLARDAHRTGLPLVRPMFLADPTDRALRELDDQFLLGDDVVVAPVLQPTATQRTVVLPSSPSGGWFLFEGGRDLLPAGRYTVEAPLGKTPIFVRAGRILVTRPVAPHVTAQREEDPELHVYFDPRQRAVGLLHEDDGESVSDRGTTTEFSGRLARGRVVIDAFADGREVVDRAWHVHAHGLPGLKS